VSALLARTPLRVKLVAAVVALSGLGLVVSGVAASTALRGYLLDRVDQQLTGFIGRRAPIGDGDGGPGGPGGNQFNTVFFQYVNASGTLTQVVPAGLKAPKVGTAESHTPHTVTSVSGDTRWRVIGAYDAQTGNPVVLGLSLRDTDSTTHRLMLLEIGVGGVVLVLLAGGGYVVVRRSLRPLVAVETAAEAIADGDFSQRVPDADPRTEVGSLSHSFNTMAARIEESFSAQAASEADARASEERMRRFVGDASHELRTPLTSIRGFAELYRQGALPERTDVDRAMSRVEGEAARMGLLVEDLLLLARLDQQRPLERSEVDLLELAGDAVQDARAIDPGREVSLEVVAAGPPPVVLGDATRLRQVFGNLAANALTHTPAGTPVQLRVSTAEGTATVEVVDHGQGISEDDRPRVFERFFRADASRTRASGGSGLGLSIVAALVAAHRGTVSVEETPGGGATFRVALPLAQSL
jgi:two-component system OmpR family sensor kinase